MIFWRCRRCGKVSTAKRRPASHQRVDVLERGPEGYRRTAMVHCGPFDRHVGRLSDPQPPADNPEFFGRKVHGTEIESGGDSAGDWPF